MDNSFSLAFKELFKKYGLEFLNISEEKNSLVLYLEILVKPSQKKTAIAKKQGLLVLSIKEKPLNNEANEAVVKKLAEICKVSPSSVIIKSGFHSKRKRTLIHYTFTEYKSLDYYILKLEEVLKLL